MSETQAQTFEVELQDEDSVPGTVHLVDIERELRAKHAGDSDIVLVPTPSNDVDDPLNWSYPRKTLATICMCVYTITVGIASAAIYSVLVPISNDTGLSLDDLNAGTGYMFLLFGWGCLFWQPLALKYGKRAVYLISMLASVAIMVWTSFATSSKGQYLASKILQGFFGAPIESLVEISVTDVWFQHQRGTYIGLYAFSLAGSSYFAPIIAGFIADGQGWQWVFYWCAIFLAIGLVFNFFVMEETNYDRVYPVSTPKSSSEKPSSDVAQLKEGERLCQNFPSHQASQEGIILNDPGPPISSGRKSYLQKLSILPESRPLQFWKMVQRPLILLSFPVISWAGFNYGSALVWFNVLNGTASSILSAPPYSFSSSIVGVAYASPFIGVCIGSLYLGRVSDWIPLKIARRKKTNTGIVEPEYRLWLFLVNAVFTPFSLILWGVGAAHDIHWFGLILSMGMTALTNCLGTQLSVLYAIDSYKELSSEALVTVILIRNTMSFALNYGLTPWITNMGLQNAFITAAFVGLMQALSFLAMVLVNRGHKTVLVVHSSGGFIEINAVPGLTLSERKAANLPGGVEKIAAITAPLVRPDLLDQIPPFFDVQGPRFFYKDPKEYLFNDMDDEAAKPWIETLQSEPEFFAYDCPPKYGPEFFDKVPATYLLCKNDRIHPAELQKTWASAARATITECDAGHMVILSQPKTVVDFIKKTVDSMTSD